MAFGGKTYNQLQHERQTNELQLEHLLRHSKRNNLVVFASTAGTPHARNSLPDRPYFRAYHGEVSLPSGQVETESAQAQGSAGGVDLCCCRASSRLRAIKIRFDEDLTLQQLRQRKGLSADSQCLKARGYKPFFRGPTLKYRDGALIRKCVKGEANKVVASAAQTARAAAPPPARQPQPPHNSVAIDPTEILHQAGVSMVREPMGPLTAAIAQIFDEIGGGIGCLKWWF